MRAILRAQNARRIDLIEKKYGEGLTDEETAELARLRSEIHEYLKGIDPRSTDALGRLDDAIAGMVARVKARRAARTKGAAP